MAAHVAETEAACRQEKESALAAAHERMERVQAALAAEKEQRLDAERETRDTASARDRLVETLADLKAEKAELVHKV